MNSLYVITILPLSISLYLYFKGFLVDTASLKAIPHKINEKSLQQSVDLCSILQMGPLYQQGASAYDLYPAGISSFKRPAHYLRMVDCLNSLIVQSNLVDGASYRPHHHLGCLERHRLLRGFVVALRRSKQNKHLPIFLSNPFAT